MANNENSSTLKSYVDSAIGTAQNALGNLTGSAGDQAQGEARKDKAELEHDASHATVKLPGATVSGSGAAARDDPNRTEGSWNQTVGATKEAVGGIIGNQSLKNAGRQQNAEGQQEAKGQLSDLGDGISNRVEGKLGGAVANVTGNKDDQAHYDQVHAKGKTQQRGVEHDFEKQAEADRRV